MRYLIILALFISVFAIVGCGGGNGNTTSQGYTLSDGWVTTPSGLKYRDLVVVHSGPMIVSGSRIAVRYKGWLDDGTVFDSTDKHGGELFRFTVGNGEVISGWDEGVLNLRPGSKTELVIPPSLGYGEQGTARIPPSSTLHFTVEIVEVL
jgi:peptidylprolyl isomerase/FKBP-type peptidyl-prolyl cis-trans isomerase FkpA